MNGNPETIINRLTAAMDALPLTGDCQSEEFVIWEKKTLAMLEVFFGKGSAEVKEFDSITFFPTNFIVGDGGFYKDREQNVTRQKQYDKEGFDRGVRDSKAFFAALIQKVQDINDLPAKAGEQDKVMAKPQSRPIFVSHAVKDADVLDGLVDLLVSGAGVGIDSIFCSSLEGMTIPKGVKFDQFINGQLQEPQLVIVLITPNYYDSAFCLCELGAAWIKAHNVYPIVVTPYDYSDLKAVLNGVQAAKLDTPGLNGLKDEVSRILKLTVDTNRWEKKRVAFLANLPKLLKKAGAPEKVSAAEHDKIKGRVNELENELKAANQVISDLTDQNELLKKCKDPLEVAEVIAATTDGWEQLEEYEEIVRGLLKNMAFSVKNAIMHHYLGAPYWPDKREDKYEWDMIMEHSKAKLLEITESGTVIPDRSDPKIRKIMNAVDRLADFIRTIDVDLSAAYADRHEHNLDIESMQYWQARLLK